MFIFFKVRFNNVEIVDRGIVESKGLEIQMMVILSRHVLKGCILEEKEGRKADCYCFCGSDLSLLHVLLVGNGYCKIYLFIFPCNFFYCCIF